MKARTNLWLVALACATSGLAVGLWLTRPGGSHDTTPALDAAAFADFGIPPLEAHATASAAHDNFVIATGLVEDGVEGLFYLDFLTGDLKGAVLNRRGPGFSALFTYNIAADFAVGAVKNPKYLMVTGLARDVQLSSGNGRLARTALYIVEATTGQVAVYGVPWNPSLHASGKMQRNTFIPLAKASLRNEFVRDQ